MDYDGEVTSASLGIDGRLGEAMLAGVALTQADASADYMGSDAQKGELTTGMTSIHPYMGWQTQGRMKMWAMAGFGSGEVEIDEETAGAKASDLTQQMLAAGASGPLMSSDELIGGGVTNLNLKGEVAFTRADIDGSGTLVSTSLSASRQRLMFEREQIREFGPGVNFTPSLEIGLRNDGGDGETGAGIEAGAAMRYADTLSGLIVEGRVRTLLSHGGDYEETGVSGLLRIAPGESGQGLAFVVHPAWGQTASGLQRMWQSGVAAGTSPDKRARLNAEIGYGLGSPHGRGQMTPYAGLRLAGEGARSWRMGANWRMATYASVSVEGILHEAANDDRHRHGLMLRAALRW